MSAEAFWVYVNEPNDRALVHRADCSFCNIGKGMAAQKLDQNGRWFGFRDQASVVAKAKRSSKKRVAWCDHCAKTLNISPEIR